MLGWNPCVKHARRGVGNWHNSDHDFCDSSPSSSQRYTTEKSSPAISVFPTSSYTCNTFSPATRSARPPPSPPPTPAHAGPFSISLTARPPSATPPRRRPRHDPGHQVVHVGGPAPPARRADERREPRRVEPGRDAQPHGLARRHVGRRQQVVVGQVGGEQAGPQPAHVRHARPWCAAPPSRARPRPRRRRA